MDMFLIIITVLGILIAPYIVMQLTAYITNSRIRYRTGLFSGVDADPEFFQTIFRFFGNSTKKVIARLQTKRDDVAMDKLLDKKISIESKMEVLLSLYEKQLISEEELKEFKNDLIKSELHIK